MAAAKRSARKRDFPRNLYERDGYYSWRNPVDGIEYGIGRDKRQAFAQAVEANLHTEDLSRSARLIDRLTGDADRSVGAWCTEYEKLLAERLLAENTRRTYKSLLARVRILFDTQAPLCRVSTLDVSGAIKTIRDGGNPRTAQALRGFLKEFFRSAQAAGWVKENPVLVTDRVSVKVQRARLTLDQFNEILDHVDLPWLRNAMLLALVSAQRREDIVLAKFSDQRDDVWWCEQAKTGNRVALPHELRLDCVGLSLGDVIKRCRGTRVLSHFLIHQTTNRGNSPRGQQIWKDTLSRRFTDAVEKLGPIWGERTPPTFHEIRSLSERLYAAQGSVKTQELLGHKDPRTTQLYHDSRGAEWVRVSVR